MRIALYLALVIPLGIPWRVTCQDLDRAHASTQREIGNPANSWQQEAHEPEAAPTSAHSSEIRALRDAYMDKVFGVGMPIEQIDQKHLSYKFPNLPLPLGSSEIPAAFPHETVVIGTFNALDPVLSKSHQTIYDEIHIAVDRVLYPEDATISGSTIDILIPGGSVLLNGQTISYRTAPQEFGLAPGHRYALFVRYVQNGDFYLLKDSISLTNGKLILTRRPRSRQ